VFYRHDVRRLGGSFVFVDQSAEDGGEAVVGGAVSGDVKSYPPLMIPGIAA
jgi:hypothetical protein